MTLRQDAEDIIAFLLPEAEPKFRRWGARWLVEVTVGDWAYFDFPPRPLLASTQPTLVAVSGSMKSMVVDLCGRVAEEAFPTEVVEPLHTREGMSTIIEKRLKHRECRLAHATLDELGALVESFASSYNQGLRDYEMKLLEGVSYGKATAGGVVPRTRVKYDLFSSTTPRRYGLVFPSRQDILDGMAVRFSPVYSERRGSDDMPPITNVETAIKPLVKSMVKLRADLMNNSMRLSHSTDSTPIYKEFCKLCRRDISSATMHSTHFNRAKVMFSRICISEEISNFGLSSHAITDISAEVASEDARESARDAYRLYKRLGPTDHMNILLDIIEQAGRKGISKKKLRETARMDGRDFKRAFESLLDNPDDDERSNGCGLVEVQKEDGTTKKFMVVRLKKPR